MFPSEPGIASPECSRAAVALSTTMRLAALLEALPPDPEAKARAVAFLARMGIKRRDED